MLAEAVLSYISIGVDPATSSWGNMINGARLELAGAGRVVVAARGIRVHVRPVLAANLFSNVVRRLRSAPTAAMSRTMKYIEADVEATIAGDRGSVHPSGSDTAGTCCRQGQLIISPRRHSYCP